jgi:hypothetical protein
LQSLNQIERLISMGPEPRARRRKAMAKFKPTFLSEWAGNGLGGVGLRAIHLP